MQYNLLNLAAILAGGAISLLVRKKLPMRQVEAARMIANLCILAVGIQGAIVTNNMMLMLLSAVLGGIIGTALGIDDGFQRLGEKLKNLAKSRDSRFSQGFVTVFMMQCIGSMAILGPINAALKGDGTILMLKSVLDFTSTLVYGTIYGSGVLLSGPMVFLYQGAIYLAAGFLSPLLKPQIVVEISAIGSLLIMALSLNLLDIVKIKVADYLPAMLGPVVYYILLNAF